MTVKKAIEILQTMPPEALLAYLDEDTATWIIPKAFQQDKLYSDEEKPTVLNLGPKRYQYKFNSTGGILKEKAVQYAHEFEVVLILDVEKY